MFNKLLILCFFIAVIFAVDRPTNYWAGNYASRGDQQQVQNFAAYNLTSKSWKNVIPPGVTTPGSLYGIVAVGNGFLAYGSFTGFNGGLANSLLYYDGNVWSAPEGVGLFKYDSSSTNPSRYEVPTTSGTAIAYAAVTNGNDVYVFGDFNQVGLQRGGVAGFVKLTWSAGGKFSIGYVGNGYSQSVAGVCSSLCPGDTNPITTGAVKYKLRAYTTTGNVNYFVMQVNKDLWTFTPNQASWVRISSSPSARGMLGAINDYDLDNTNGNIYAVGKFDNTNDADTTRQYLHIAVSNDGGINWRAVSSPQPLPTISWATLPPVVDTVSGNTVFPGLDCTGVTAIYVESGSSIYIAGGWRDPSSRNISVSNVAGQMQTKVFQISSGTLVPLTNERFGGSRNGNYGPAPEYMGNNIYRIVKAQGIVFAWGTFDVYRYVVPNVGSRFGQRFTEVMKGASCFVNNAWTQAFGGWVTNNGYASDTSPTDFGLAWSPNQDTAYFIGIVTSGGNILNTYGLVSGGLFGWGGEKKLGQYKKWNSVLGNRRFASAVSFTNGWGQEGQVFTTHITKKGDALIIGGQFDFIGQSQIAGVAWYDSVADTVASVGGGLFIDNNDQIYGADQLYNNRYGGNVYDFEEWNDYLIAGGNFNRNNTGGALYNIAWAKFRKNGEGWMQLDGGCDQIVRDVLVVGNLLYATGDFLFCGLRNDAYQGGLQRGRTPTSRIAVIDLSDKNKSWRNLGVGLNAQGLSMAWRGGYLYVGGSFGSAGGRLNTAGIARWNPEDQKWMDVVSKCRTACNRPVNVIAFQGTAIQPDVVTRRPFQCKNLREFDGLLWCYTTTAFANIPANSLVYYDGNTWYQTVDTALQDLPNSPTPFSNTFIGRNATRSQSYLVPSSIDYDSNGLNLLTYDQRKQHQVVTYGGFSIPTASI